ncbi:triple tyrosine motif-containing protein [Flaviaesturariibacter amylovorans]|uniref:Triple tyrosine motif-containing protein n=1 Tax=Flaviaesturariibacter amylovorans TaxID=1084520 RepID=A0ABP8GJI5_9BACT
MRFHRFLLLLVLLAASSASGQHTIGLPDILNYTKDGYKAGTQSWDIRQDARGVLYFANNEGLLTFDGHYWKTYPLPNRTIVRSVAIGRDGRIYVGGQDEFGYFAPGPNGALRYHSMKALLPARDRSFADVWDIVFHEKQLFFRTSQRLFQFNGDQVTVTYGADWRYLDTCGGALIAQDNERGLLRFRNGLWEPVVRPGSLPRNFLVTAILPWSRDSMLLTTFRQGSFFLSGDRLLPFETPALREIAGKLIYTATVADPDHFLLATTLDGAYIVDRRGIVTQRFTRSEGLQNNNILSVFFDREKNLWLALDNGIDFVAYDSPVRHIYTSPQNEGSGYTSLLYRDHLYIGTSNGLYTVPLEGGGDLSYRQGTFSPVPGTRGQVWNLSEVNGRLLMGHHEGAFGVEPGGAKPIDNSFGYWAFLPYGNVLPAGLMVTGNYYGVRLFHSSANGIGKEAATAPFESSRFITVDNNDGTIWVAHPYKGIYKVRFDGSLKPSIRRYATGDGLFTINNNYIFKVRNRIVATTEGGIYEYDAPSDRFLPSKYFKGIFDHANIRLMREDSEGNIWFVHDKQVGVIDFSADKPRILYIPELTNKLVNGFEHIYPINPQNILIGAEKGFVHINFEKYKRPGALLQVQIRDVRAIGPSDSLLFGGYTNGATPRAEVANAFNTLHFAFSATAYGLQKNVEYSYYLKGYDKAWSEWSGKVEKEYPYLPAGTYTFQVRARTTLGTASEMSTFTFTVLPPWYRSGWAYAVYAALLVAGGLWLVRWQRRKFARQQQRHEEEQRRLLYLHQLELEKTEKEIMRLNNEKLEAEIEHKNTELASSAMHLVQKGELIGRLREELTRIKKKIDTDVADAEFRKIIRILNEEDKVNEDWDHFAHHFDKVHGNFLTALKKQYPTLTPNELKLSAYLRMNLSSKEVAQLMNISVRGVEISRYRLRKKLQLPTETNLFEFLIAVHPN